MTWFKGKLIGSYLGGCKVRILTCTIFIQIYLFILLGFSHVSRANPDSEHRSIPTEPCRPMCTSNRTDQSVSPDQTVRPNRINPYIPTDPDAEFDLCVPIRPNRPEPNRTCRTVSKIISTISST